MTVCLAYFPVGFDIAEKSFIFPPEMRTCFYLYIETSVGEYSAFVAGQQLAKISVDSDDDAQLGDHSAFAPRRNSSFMQKPGSAARLDCDSLVSFERHTRVPKLK